MRGPTSGRGRSALAAVATVFGASLLVSLMTLRGSPQLPVHGDAGAVRDVTSVVGAARSAVEAALAAGASPLSAAGSGDGAASPGRANVGVTAEGAPTPGRADVGATAGSGDGQGGPAKEVGVGATRADGGGDADTLPEEVDPDRITEATSQRAAEPSPAAAERSADAPPPPSPPAVAALPHVDAVAGLSGVIPPPDAAPPGRPPVALSSPIALRAFGAPRTAGRRLLRTPVATDDGMTHMECAGGAEDNRTCTFTNMCWNIRGDDWPRHRLEMYAPTAGGGKRCVAAGGPDPITVCDNDIDWLWTGTVRSHTCQYRATIKEGPIDASRVAAWIPGHAIVFNRHYPDNYAHAVADDFFPLWLRLKSELGWTPESAFAWMDAGLIPLDTHAPPPDVAAAAAAGAAGPTPYSIFYNDFAGGPGYASSRLFARVFPNVRQLNQYKFAEDFGAKGDKQYVCFKSVFMGAAGLSMMRNGAYANNPARRWPHIDPAEYLREQVLFTDYMARVLSRTRTGRDGAVAAMAGRAGSVVLITRPPHKTKGPKRVIRNADKLVTALEAHGGRAMGGRTLIQHAFGNASIDVDTMQGADLVIAVHGAGSVNLWFLRPGAVWIDLLPPRVPSYQPVMLSLAQRFGVRFASQMLTDENCTYHKPHDAPFYGVDVGALTGLVSLMLGAEP